MSAFITKYRCRYCDWLGADSELLKAPSPFDGEDILRACPECKQCANGFDLICSIPGCEGIGGCGFPTRAHGYIWTCHKHWKEYEHT